MAKVIKINEEFIFVANEDQSVLKIPRSSQSEEFSIGDEVQVHQFEDEFIINKVVVQTVNTVQKKAAPIQQTPRDFRNVFENPEQRMKTLHLVLFSLASGGIYLVVHLWHLTKLLEQHFNKQIISKTMLYVCTICFGLYISGTFTYSGMLVLSVVGDDAYIIFLIFTLISYLLLLAYSIIAIIWAWNTRNLLEQYAQSKGITFEMNKILTVILGVYYINYLTNQLAEKEVALK